MGEGPICSMCWICPSTTKQHENTNPFVWWVNRGHDRNINSFKGRNLLWCLKWKGLEFVPSLQITHKVLIDPQIIIFEPFNRFHCLKGLILTKKQDLDKKWTIFFNEMNIMFNVVRHPTFLKVMKVTSKSQTYYKPPSYHGSHINLLK
jgi:hypothetical protein